MPTFSEAPLFYSIAAETIKSPMAVSRLANFIWPKLSWTASHFFRINKISDIMRSSNHQKMHSYFAAMHCIFQVESRMFESFLPNEIINWAAG